MEWMESLPAMWIPRPSLRVRLLGRDWAAWLTADAAAADQLLASSSSYIE